MKDLDKIADAELKSLDSLLSDSGNKKSLEEFIAPYLAQWRWILLSVIVLLIAAFIYLRYADKKYKVNSTIILKDQDDSKIKNSSAILSPMDLMGTVSNVDNEIEVLKSKYLIRTTINKLNLHTSYVKRGRVKSTDMYTRSPILVSMEQSDLDRLKEPYSLTVVIHKNQSITVIQDINGKDQEVKITKLPALLRTKYGVLTFAFRPGNVPDYGAPIEVIIKPPMSVVPFYRKNLTIAPTSNTTSVLGMELLTPETEKGKDFLKTLVEMYNHDAIADKNREALNTKDFIDERIAIINQELGDAERNVEQYKKSQGLTDLQSDVQLSQQRSSQYEQRLVDVSTQLNMVDYLDRYVADPGNRNKLIPSNVGVDDPTLVATINEYNKQVLERDRLLRTNTESNPVVQKIDGQIEAMRDAIGSSISSVKQGLNIARRDAQNQVNLYRSQTGMAPTQERQFSEISREQQIKSSLFLMLLQKREENALALSASANSARILDEAAASGPVAPKPILVLMAALLLGLLIPIFIIYLRDLLHFKIESRFDVEKLTKLPILGEIPASDVGNIAVEENQNRETDEAFRMLRTNLLFQLGKDQNVVIVTSAESKEGKTFVAINTAISMALLGKKVLLIGLDLRLPRMSEYMNIEADNGMSQYLSGYTTDIFSLIQESGITPNLYAISSGTVPPNPTELISKDTFEKGIAELRDRFDYIIIDSAPVGLVTDTIVASKSVDATLYVCRANVSHKNSLKFVNELSEKKMLPNVGLVVNGISNYVSGYGGYGRTYSYGYGYDYSKRKKKKKITDIDTDKILKGFIKKGED